MPRFLIDPDCAKIDGDSGHRLLLHVIVGTVVSRAHIDRLSFDKAAARPLARLDPLASPP